MTQQPAPALSHHTQEGKPETQIREKGKRRVLFVTDNETNAIMNAFLRAIEPNNAQKTEILDALRRH